MSRLRVSLLVSLGFAFRLAAQDVTGALSGTVTDSSGAVVAGAKVTVFSTARGAVVFDGKTSDSGAYSAPALPAGVYSLRVEAKGFKRAEVSSLPCNSSSAPASTSR